jgi:hypothetical protein
MDPLAQLKTIHLPEQINNYPLAYGWWILLFTLCLVCVLALKKYLKYRSNCQVKRQAMKSLKEMDLDVEQLISLLKWAALHYFPRQQIASLSGEKLLAFLTSSLPTKQQEVFTRLFQPTLVKRYQRDEQHQSTDDLSTAVMLWLENALPPSKQIRKTFEESEQHESTKVSGASA